MTPTFARLATRQQLEPPCAPPLVLTQITSPFCLYSQLMRYFAKEEVRSSRLAWQSSRPKLRLTAAALRTLTRLQLPARPDTFLDAFYASQYTLAMPSFAPLGADHVRVLCSPGRRQGGPADFGLSSSERGGASVDWARGVVSSGRFPCRIAGVAVGEGEMDKWYDWRRANGRNERDGAATCAIRR